MRILFMIALAILPALVIGEEEKTAAANFQAVCDFYAQEIKKLEENKKELKDLVKWESVLYEKLNSSSGICNAIGYLALPECAIKKEGVNVFDKLDDKCAEDKTNKITKSLKKVLGLGTEPSGQVVFRSCKDIFVKIILEQFKKMQGLISSQCDQSTSTSPARRKRSYGGGYYHGGYDPSTIWFQYLLCHEQKISCYFFTQGWNEKEFGQYYLYENVLDTDLHSLGHGSSGTHDDLLFLALLSGAGGSHQPYHAYPSYKKRREVEDKVAENDEDDQGRRRRRHTATTTTKSTKKVSSGDRRRRNIATATKSTTEVASEGRRRRDTAATATKSTNKVASGDRRRRDTATKSTTKMASGDRRRRETATTKSTTKVASGDRRRRETATTTKSTFKVASVDRRRRDTAATTTKSTIKVASGDRRRRETATTSTTEVASGGRRRRHTATTKTTSTTVASGGRRRRSTADSEWIDCKNDDGSPCE